MKRTNTPSILPNLRKNIRFPMNLSNPNSPQSQRALSVEILGEYSLLIVSLIHLNGEPFIFSTKWNLYLPWFRFPLRIAAEICNAGILSSPCMNRRSPSRFREFPWRFGWGYCYEERRRKRKEGPEAGEEEEEEESARARSCPSPDGPFVATGRAQAWAKPDSNM